MTDFTPLYQDELVETAAEEREERCEGAARPGEKPMVRLTLLNRTQMPKRPASSPEARVGSAEGETGSRKAAAFGLGLSREEKFALVEEALEDIRRYIAGDGGDCQLVDIEDNKIMVRLTGACVGCQLAGVTIGGIQMRLMAKLGAPVRVIPVHPRH
ncbi:NifU family protein [Afifella sp. JA880]|uniref:NifU family protein n=1 Tax=Afifella sp. JA880 TaxID=2975280 RepID=UPI0021BA78F2|nr:NifU family protein [Afifella sp. JA880]MCT8267409.1 NifU family protein [Afifella sp. JA880]